MNIICTQKKNNKKSKISSDMGSVPYPKLNINTPTLSHFLWQHSAACPE